MKKKAKSEATIEELYLMVLDEQMPYTDKRRIQTSKTYLGYKLLWTINRFLDGKLNPKNRMNYTYHIVKFIQLPGVLLSLLDIDATTAFDVILKLYAN